MRPDGFLFLGKAEALQSRDDLFVAYDLRRRVFTKSPTGIADNRYDAPVTSPPERPLPAPGDQARDSGFEQSPFAQLIVDAEGPRGGDEPTGARDVRADPARRGRPLRDLEISYRPLELRSRIDEARESRLPLVVNEVPWPQPNGEHRFLDVSFMPLHGRGGNLAGVGIGFTDVSRFRVLQNLVELNQRELETAYEELQSTVEELETTNEELQSTNEELETTNEELQSTNEELETMNEELNSTNEELETMNDELRDRTDDALRANVFLSSILGSIHQSVIVLDPELRVVQWSAASADLWGLRANEVEGEHFLNLDIGLPTAELRAPVREALADGQPRAARDPGPRPPRPAGRVRDLPLSPRESRRRGAGRHPRHGGNADPRVDERRRGGAVRVSLVLLVWGARTPRPATRRSRRRGARSSP